MFDAKSLLENIVRGGAQQRAAGASSGASGGGLEDLIRQMMPSTGNNAPAVDASSPTSGGALGDILSQIQSKVGSAGGSGGLTEMLGQVFGQAMQGTREGASHVGQATGTSDALNDLLAKLPPDAVAKVRELIANNPLAAGAVLGGLGSVILGTGTGRSLAGSALKLGAVTLIGGLAYKAYQNYQAGKPLISGADDSAVSKAPAGSGFEPEAVDNDQATLLIRTMIAAAASDGRVDDVEQAAILASMQQSGLGSEAETFLANELNAPASIEDIAGAVTTEQHAVQVYTAARLAISPDTIAEKDFLAKLARALSIDPTLAAHIDATAASSAA